MITKKAQDTDKYKRQWIYTESARNAWSSIIEKYKSVNPEGTILLPSYIGWSSNEGSGIFDSVLNSGMKFEFYGLGLHLEIDFNDLKNHLSKDKSHLVLLVHYFGFIDSKYNEITNWLIEKNVFFVEDCAHAWLTDLVGGSCGRKGSFSFYSLHKLLSVATGGVLVSNNPEQDIVNESNPFLELNYDLFSIYKIRRFNYNYLVSLLKDVNGIDVIYKELNEGICPQTLPVIVENFDRTTLYHKMNEKGFGMVSLYHTMITELDNSPYEAANSLAKKIINFPIHQDVTVADIDAMVLELKKILNA
ncbi:DegT/DnrJ/EryC1/StrS family aminotransferase [Flavobacterium sp. P4023]|uniref:DegT/DnrJ/EryC1/StrS family aminotransferase n=1 Tax=Flavobacterium flabelliforme TaxID=2816119 RepID=A0ABS5CSC3_9FLAO|nr:DegT/DnrJ/EryC1/StrS family aminotransferase [Flavobacterium flabelliforme]MBP4141519.1 DegT/DnrJ/EryC1/StrS family aminotransferase [Flavobacterium flabelliforme]